jgi:DnaJ-class molecular chaperone
MSDLYETLGVARDADTARIKQAFRALAKAHHPDVNAGDKGAEQRFKTLNHAYATLRVRATRAAYDAAWSQERARERKRRRRAAMTMAATFMLTVSSGLSAATWMRFEGLI